MITVNIIVFNPVSVNTYILSDETKEAVIIDCGCATPAEEEILSCYVSKNDLKIKRLLCTHLHFDHVLGNAFASRTYGALPEAHRNEVEQLPSPKEQIRSMWLPLDVDFIDVKNYLEDPASICFGESELTVFLVPGHSPGSLSFYSPKDGFIVVGDTLFDNSIGRTDLWGGNHHTLIKSIKERIFTLPDNTVVYPGHGNATTVDREKRYNPYLRS
ncbi:MAG: MBL fold metallo-hydrolase [Tannerella sp.]|jgi:glyoxylase-like metal-dependent hydrolase (beta-lactamase superfamily II)|nr:MBL fold metallo-hydrolase [Tannerella sp.]